MGLSKLLINEEVFASEVILALSGNNFIFPMTGQEIGLICIIESREEIAPFILLNCFNSPLDLSISSGNKFYGPFVSRTKEISGRSRREVEMLWGKSSIPP